MMVLREGGSDFDADASLLPVDQNSWWAVRDAPAM